VLPTNHIRSTDHVILTPLEDHLQPDTSEGNLVSEIETFLSHLDDSSTSKTNDLEINFENPDDLLMEFLITNKEPSEVTVPVNQEIRIDSSLTLDLKIVTKNPSPKTQMKSKPKTNLQRVHDYRKRKKNEEILRNQELKDLKIKNSDLKVKFGLLENEVRKRKKIMFKKFKSNNYKC